MTPQLKTKFVSSSYDSSYVREILMKDYYVSDGIQEDFKSWLPTSPVFISAQTGRGKNHFIENTLLPYIIENNLKLLVLSNRIAVSTQQKKRIALKTSCEKYFDIYTSKGFEQETQYGAVTIMTYQGFWEKFKITKGDIFTAYQYVILDEAHFFMSDALFNSETGAFLNEICQIFSQSIRVYLSATPEEILPEVVNVEQACNLQYKKNLSINGWWYFHPPELLLYTFKRDYKYIQANYFNKKQEILQEIKEDKTSNKWIIFVRSIDEGNYFKENLGEVSRFICSANRNNVDNHDEWLSLVEDEKFHHKVLIATSVLDNGININDKLLKNIVILSPDKTSFLQMLGRKRVPKEEKVNLFFKVPSMKIIAHDLTQSQERKSMIKLSKNNYPKFLKNYVLEGNRTIQDLFYLDENNTFRPNHLALIKLNRQIEQLERWKNSDSIKILKEILGWINHKYNQANWLNSKDLSKQNLLKLLIDYEGKELTQDDFKAFAALYKQLRIEVYGKHCNDRSDRGEWGSTTVRNRLESDDLGYTLDVTNGIYIVKKTKEKN